MLRGNDSYGSSREMQTAQVIRCRRCVATGIGRDC